MFVLMCTLTYMQRLLPGVIPTNVTRYSEFTSQKTLEGGYDMRCTACTCTTVPFRIVRPSRVTGPVDMDEIGHLSWVTAKVADA